MILMMTLTLKPQDRKGFDTEAESLASGQSVQGKICTGDWKSILMSMKIAKHVWVNMVWLWTSRPCSSYVGAKHPERINQYLLQEFHIKPTAWSLTVDTQVLRREDVHWDDLSWHSKGATSEIVPSSRCGFEWKGWRGHCKEKIAWEVGGTRRSECFKGKWVVDRTKEWIPSTEVFGCGHENYRPGFYTNEYQEFQAHLKQMKFQQSWNILYSPSSRVCWSQNENFHTMRLFFSFFF